MDDVRATYLRFPAWTQHFWTWQTGKALSGQQPLLRHTWASYLAVTLTTFLAGLALSAFAVARMFPFWYLALLAGWTLTVAGERLMVLVIAHQALHRRFSGRSSVDWFWGEVVTVLTVFHTFRDFKEEHFDNHHRREVFATRADPPVQFLLDLGFTPGLSRTALWRRAWTVFLSPVFYWRGFTGRVGSNLKAGGWRIVGFAVWVGGWLSLPSGSRTGCSCWCSHSSCRSSCRPAQRIARPAGRARVAGSAQPRVRAPLLHRGQHRRPVLRRSGARPVDAARTAAPGVDPVDFRHGVLPHPLPAARCGR